MDHKQNLQEQEYEFPYHYLPTLEQGNFTQHKNLYWGYEYLSYITFVLEQLKNLSFTSLIDLGCGDGRFTREAAREFSNKTIVGSDYSPHAINLARALNPNLTFIVEDITKQNLSRTHYDCGTLIEVIEHIPPEEMASFVQGLHASLKPGGILYITTPTENIPVIAKHYQHFTREKFEKIFTPLFSIENVFYLNMISWKTNLIARLLSNRLFVLNNPYFINKLYAYYYKHLLIANEHTGRRICVMLKKA